MEGFGGIGGTPAIKFGIYCDKGSQNYVYDKEKYDSPEAGPSKQLNLKFT